MIRVLVSVLMWVALQSAAVAQDRAPGTVLKDCADCPEMVVIPAGRFLMGTTPTVTTVNSECYTDFAWLYLDQRQINSFRAVLTAEALMPSPCR